MPITSLFRAILIAGLGFLIVSIIAGSALSDTLPTILQDYLAKTEIEDPTDSEVLMLLSMLVVLMLLAGSIFGLWKFKRWARTLYVFLYIVYVPFYFVLGPVVMNVWEAMFNDLSLMLDA